MVCLHTYRVLKNIVPQRSSYYRGGSSSFSSSPQLREQQGLSFPEHHRPSVALVPALLERTLDLAPAFTPRYGKGRKGVYIKRKRVMMMIAEVVCICIRK